MNDMIRQRMIVRQSSLKLAVELLIQEQGDSTAMIPLEKIKALTNDLEKFVLELDGEPTTQLNKEGKGVKKLVMDI